MTDGGDDHRFDASDETRARWGAGQRVILASAVVLGLSLLLLLAFGNADRSDLLVAGIVVVVMLVWIGVYWFARRSAGWRSAGAWWSGAGTLNVGALQEEAAAGDLRITSPRRYRWLTRGVGVVLAHFDVGPRGLCWRLGPAARLVGASGQLRVAWKDIRRVEVGAVPGTIHALGGGVSVHLVNGGRVDAQFLGSESALKAALKKGHSAS